MKKNSKQFQFVFFIIALIVIFFIYSQGISGALYYDDTRPISALGDLSWDNPQSILFYVGLETSGPLGRPVSMLSFLLNLGDYPNHLQHIFLINIIIHLLNGILLALLARSLCRLRGLTDENATWIGIVTSLLWLILPIQVSTSLIAIQRMAGLSALFVFAGLLIHIIGLQQEFAGNKAKALSLQILGLLLFTLLSTLSKENGILLPVLALVIESVLLRDILPKTPLYKIRRGFCIALLFALIAYLIYSAIKIGDGSFPGRDFGVIERLMSEAPILLDYLKQAFFPSIYNFHPFHDGYPIVHSYAQNPWAAVAAIGCLALLAWTFIDGKRSPFLAFAIIWFFAAHLLESTTLSLELYFEHRNYVALFGICFALVYALFSVPEQYKKISRIGACLYGVMLLVLLNTVTSLWGSPDSAVQTWYNKAEHQSSRMAERLANLYSKQKYIHAAYDVMAKQSKNCPNCFIPSLQSMILACALNLPEETKHHYQNTLLLAGSPLRQGEYHEALSSLLSRTKSGECKLISHQQIADLHLALLNNEQKKTTPQASKAIHINLAALAYERKDMVRAIAEIKQAWNSVPEKSIGKSLIDLMLLQGQIEQAKDFFWNGVCHDISRHPIKAMRDEEICQAAYDSISAAIEREKATHNNNQKDPST